ncbi:hypothetical protein MASR1M107_09620 [Ignavibacteriales bacterium]
MEFMDPINILVLVALIFFTTANYSGSQKSFKGKVSAVSRRASGWIQTIPPNVLGISALLQFIGVFPLFDPWFFGMEIQPVIRIIAFALFILFSYTHLRSFKSLGNNYSIEILLYKEHKLVTNGLYGIVRHPQYLSQILADLCVGVALISLPVVLITLLLSLPLLIIRGKKEEEMLQSHFKEEFVTYRKKTGFFIPFL